MGWRSSLAAIWKKYMASQAPLVVLRPSRLESFCCFYNISDHSICKVMLPSLAGRSIKGFSGGYLIMEDPDYNLHLVDPFTRQEIQFASTPSHSTDGIFLNNFVMAARMMPSQTPVVLALSFYGQSLRFCRFGDVEWTIYSFAAKPWKIVDFAVFKAKLYVLTNQAEIGVFSLSSLDVTLLEVKCTPTIRPGFNLHLVAGDEKLLMIVLTKFNRMTVYELNFVKMEWLKVESLADEALFMMRDVKSSALISNPTRWEGCSNNIYHIPFFFDVCYEFSFNGTCLRCFRTPHAEYAGGVALSPFCWYFPHQFNSLAHLRED